MRNFSPVLALNLALVACDDFIEKANTPTPTAVQKDLADQLAIREAIQDKVYECRHLYTDSMSNTSGYVGQENLTVNFKPEEVTCMDANQDGYIDGVKKATDTQATSWFYDPMLHRYMKEEGPSTPQFDFTANQIAPNANHEERMATLSGVLDEEAYCGIGEGASANWIFTTKDGTSLPSGLALIDSKGEPLNSNGRKQYKLTVNVLDEVTGFPDQVVSEWECN